MTTGRTAERDATLAALAELGRCLAGVPAEVGELAERARQLGDQLLGDRALAEAMAEEPRPLLITAMTELLGRLTACGTRLRRAEARELRAEGLSQEEIASVFGVTRQRVATLLAEDRRPVGAAGRLARANHAGGPVGVPEGG